MFASVSVRAASRCHKPLDSTRCPRIQKHVEQRSSRTPSQLRLFFRYRRSDQPAQLPCLIVFFTEFSFQTSGSTGNLHRNWILIENSGTQECHSAGPKSEAFSPCATHDQCLAHLGIELRSPQLRCLRPPSARSEAK